MDVTILNILQVQSVDLAKWISEEILNLKLPECGPNCTISIQNDIMPILAAATNRMSLITNFYNTVIGAKAPWSSAKKSPDTKSAAESVIVVLNAHAEILYRTLQSLEAIKDSASRLMTGASQNDRFNRF